jgi:hypothetical protein
MSKFQVSFETHDDVDEDLDSFDSGGKQADDKGVLDDDDGEFSIAERSLVGISTGLSAKQKAAQQERSTLGAKETRAIFCLRLVVLLTLTMIGVSFALALFYHTNAAQAQEFEDQFGFYRDQVFEKFNRNLERKLNALDSLSTDMTSYAKSSGSEFPFVTIPDFEFRGANARISGDAPFIFYMPYITEGTRVSWETYAAANRATYSEALDSEQASKTTQDESYGLKTPEIDGMGRETLDFMEAINAGLIPSPFNTSEIWSSAMDYKNVSALQLDATSIFEVT